MLAFFATAFFIFSTHDIKSRLAARCMPRHRKTLSAAGTGRQEDHHRRSGLSVPVGLSIAGIAYLQAWAAPIPINPAVDPIAVIAGWSDLAASVDSFARREGAAYILTSSYALTSEMMYYSTLAIPVVQYNERLRWVSFEQPEPNVLSRPGLYLADANRDLSNELTSRFTGQQTRPRSSPSRAIRKRYMARLYQASALL